MDQNLWKELCQIAGEENVSVQEPMKSHTTFRIGGPADYFVTPHTADEIKRLILMCKRENIPYYVVGNGSNLLVSDRGIRGVVIQIFKNFNEIVLEESGVIRAQSGALLSKIANFAKEQHLAGFEFAGGIPGTVGGAVMMNAGAYGGEMKDVLKGATVLDREGNIFFLSKEELDLSYRHSIIGEKGYIVLEAWIALERGSKEAIEEKMEDFKLRRVTKQPLDCPSAGSTFKRPQGYFAGKLIMDAGLRGFSVGGAQVSEKHCGFVINKGNATSADVEELIREVQRIVKEKFGVELEPEIKKIGEYDN
ncbi:MAG: UDP-N-acetylmuramate dehydrogenase [Lachnospiraceae bacterium]|nr:UDP-N-acetylmuramate dehydrogenase [Robinsoniella sp.]MDY3766218.1 UDP-N-acetylmuramate dehydrogenase [Lachnospiraceae bacterium]